MDDVYKSMPVGEIPWNIAEPPEALVRLIKNGTIHPCKTIDFGCGTGNHAIYLGSLGFDVTGVDISPTAVNIAEENTIRKGVKCRFITANALGDFKEVEEIFDFAFEWELLHHIFPEERIKYVENVYKSLSEGGRYLSLCFSENDPQFGGKGKYRETPIGTTLYFSSEDEIRELFHPYYHIEELKTIEVNGKYGPHLAVYAFMTKKEGDRSQKPADRRKR